MTPVWRTVALLASLLLAGCDSSAELPPVWVGHLADVSGPGKAGGENARRGIELAVEEANKDPTTRGAGRPVRVRHTDTHGDPEAFGSEVTRLVSVNKVRALIGGSGPAEIEQFHRQDQSGVILVSPSGLPGESLGDKRVFFTGLAPAQQGRALARFAVKEKFAHVVVLVEEDDRHGRSRALADAFTREFPGAWAKQHPRVKASLSGPHRYGKDDPIDKRAEAILRDLAGAGEAKGAKPDAILVAGKAAAVKKLRQGLKSSVAILLGAEEGSLSDLLDEPRTAGAVYLATAFVPDAGTEQAREFVKKFKEHFDGREPDVHAALAHDGARLMFQAMRQVKTLESDQVRKELADIKEFAGLTGPLSFDSSRQARRTVFIVRVDGGKAATVERYPARK